MGQVGAKLGQGGSKMGQVGAKWGPSRTRWTKVEDKTAKLGQVGAIRPKKLINNFWKQAASVDPQGYWF